MPDADGEAAIRADWDALAEVGLPNAGTNPSPSNRPHLSVAVRAGLGDTVRLLAVADGLPLEIALGGLVLFPHGDRVVLARGVVASPELLSVHGRVSDATSSWGEALPHSVAGAWTPHLTLARRLRVDDVPAALRAIANGPDTIRMASLRVWDGIRRELVAIGGE